MLTARVNDIDMAYEVHGSGDPLVLVHGFTGTSLDWAGVVDELASERQVVTVDHRGHGGTTNTGDAATYTIPQLASDLAGLLAHLDLRGVDLLGHSMGGVVVQKVVLADPGAARSLILMDTMGEPISGPSNFFASGIDLVKNQGLDGLYDMIAPFIDDEQVKAQMKVKYAQMDPIAFIGLAEQLGSFEATLPRLSEIAVPTTVIVGENDKGLRGGADALAAAIPGAVLDVIEAAAHSPQVENRDRWLASVRAHLTRV